MFQAGRIGIVGLAMAVAGCGGGAARVTDGNPPWSALTSPTAAMEVVFNEVCLPAVLGEGSIETLALARYMQPVDVRQTGSSQATAAWRLGSWSEVYVMALPNGGCSASVEAGDAEGLSTRAVELLQARGTFEPGPSVPARNGDAINTPWCAPGDDRPVVVGLIQKTGGRRGPAFLANVFRAQGARPPFCQA